MMDMIQGKKDKKRRIRMKSGSFCLEITLLFPIFMAILFSFIWQMSVIRCEMIFKSIVIKEAEKISFFGALSEYIPRIEAETSNEIEDSIADGAIHEIYAVMLKKQIQEHYILACEKNRTFRSLILDHAEFIEAKTTEDTLFLISRYRLYTPFMIYERQFKIPLRLWDHGDHSGVLVRSTDGNIWKYDNFTRGKVLRRRFGGNLPFGFPVLSGFSNGTALIIKSMNLLSETWSDTVDVRFQMQESIDALASYCGMPYAWGEEGILIREAEIRNRLVRFIIPENTDMEAFSDVFEEVKEYGETNGVSIEIIPYQQA